MRSSDLSQRQLLVVTGKGGVGKSTVSAALGMALARSGKSVLVLEIDPRESVNRMLGVEPSAGEVVQVEDGLYLQNFDVARVLDQVVRERVPLAWIVKRVLRSPVYQQFSGSAPGLKELGLLGHCMLAAQGRAAGVPAVDVVVLDAPATGHGTSLLGAPALVSEVIKQGPFGRLTSEVARFIAAEDGCGVVLVTLAEEMPVNETIEAEGHLAERLNRRSDLIVANGLYPVWHGSEASSPEEELWHSRRQINEVELTRLEAMGLPVVELDLAALDSGPALTERLARDLLAQLDRSTDESEGTS